MAGLRSDAGEVGDRGGAIDETLWLAPCLAVLGRLDCWIFASDFSFVRTKLANVLCKC